MVRGLVLLLLLLATAATAALICCGACRLGPCDAASEKLCMEESDCESYFGKEALCGSVSCDIENKHKRCGTGELQAVLRLHI